MNRWPTFALVVAVLAGLTWFDAVQGTPEEHDESVLAVSIPLAPVPNDTQGSTWYCAGGFTTPDASNDHIIVMTNVGDAPATGNITLYPALIDSLGDPVSFERAVQPVSVEAGSHTTVSLAPIVASLHELLASPTGSLVGVVVEFESGGVFVEHAIITPAGRDSARCQTTAAELWWFTSGTTTPGATYQLYLLNPFADDAVVDVTFLTDEGSRIPSNFDSRLIPSHGLTRLDVSGVLPPWDQVAAEVRAVSGRVIAEKIQIFAGESGPQGVSLAAGESALAEQWFFPAGGALPGLGESYVIYNPTDTAADVEFEAIPDRAVELVEAAPMSLVVGPKERWIVNVASHPEHPVDAVAAVDATMLVEPGQGFFASISSYNQVGLVVERVLTSPRDLGRGITAGSGITHASTDQTLTLEGLLAPVSAAAVPLTGEVAVLNASSETISRVELHLGNEVGSWLWQEVELAPLQRATLDLEGVAEQQARWVRVVSTTPTMVELVGSSSNSVVSIAATAMKGTVERPVLWGLGDGEG